MVSLAVENELGAGRVIWLAWLLILACFMRSKAKRGFNGSSSIGLLRICRGRPRVGGCRLGGGGLGGFFRPAVDPIPWEGSLAGFVIATAGLGCDPD